MDALGRMEQALGHEGQTGLDQTLRNAAARLSSAPGVERGSRIAVLSMRADPARLSNYLVDEMIVALMGVGGQGFTVVSRSDVELALVREQLDFDMSGEVDDQTAQHIGRFMGVQFIVAGEFEPLAGFFRFRARIIEVETAAIREIYAANVRSDDIIAYLRGGTLPAPAVTAPPPVPPPHGMVRVQGGTFNMGGRSVTVSSFYMDAHLVTQHEWTELMGTNPSRFRGATSRWNG